MIGSSYAIRWLRLNLHSIEKTIEESSLSKEDIEEISKSVDSLKQSIISLSDIKASVDTNSKDIDTNAEQLNNLCEYVLWQFGILDEIKGDD